MLNPDQLTAEDIKKNKGIHIRTRRKDDATSSQN